MAQGALRDAVGRPSAKPHTARWQQPRQAAQRYGYARVAPEPDRDEAAALRAAGCVRVWTERPPTSGYDTLTAERDRLLEYLHAEDVLVVWRLDRLALSVGELAEIAARLRKRRIELRSLGEDLDSTRPGAAQLFNAIAAIATLDARAGGARDGPATNVRSPRRKGGRPRLLDEQAHAAVRAMYDARRHTIDEIAAAHGVSRPTVYRSLKRTTPASPSND